MFGITVSLTLLVLQAEIEKLTHDYLGLVHFPPLLKVDCCKVCPLSCGRVVFGFQCIFEPFSSQDELETEVEKSKTVNLELVFGYHWKPGTGKSVSLYTHTHTTYSSAMSI